MMMSYNTDGEIISILTDSQYRDIVLTGYIFPTNYITQSNLNLHTPQYNILNEIKQDEYKHSGDRQE